MFHITKSTIHDGPGVTTTSSTEAYPIDIQCAISHGNATVSDTASITAIGYSSGKATLTPFAYQPHDPGSQKGTVHVPIHNPLAITKSLTLQSILVNFDVVDDASVDSVTLYYDSKNVVTTSTTKKATFYIDFTSSEASSYAYSAPAGICVTLNLRFPNADSCINLYSVTLVYKASS